MSKRFSKFQDVFTGLLEAPDKETRDEKIRFEQMMTADFLGTLNNVRNAETREEGDAILAVAMTGEYSDFADELSDVEITPQAKQTTMDTDNLYDLVDMMANHGGTLGGSAFLSETLAGRHSRFADELFSLKTAAKRSEGNREIDALMDMLIDYASTLVAIKNAPTLEDGNEIIKAAIA